MGRVGARVMLAVAVGAGALLAGEGLISLLAGRSLLGPRREGAVALPSVAPAQAPPGDEDRRKAALTNPGLYRAHRDPLVGYVLKSDAEQQILEGTVRSDRLGLRVRPVPAVAAEAGAEALRVAVLGDSVAFGYGLDDDQTLAHQLETQLSAVRGPGAPPVVAHTVAMPGWNHRNSVHCLLDHLDELDPDLVIYLPVGNDLIDTDSVWETGHRRAAPDVANPDPWLQVGVRTNWPFLAPLLAQAQAGADPAEIATRLGPLVLNSGLPGESSRRYAENAASIALLSRVMAARGGHVLVVNYVESEYATHLLRHLQAVADLADGDDGRAALAAQTLFKSFPQPFQLADDPHPNAQAAGVMATLVADELLRRGWVERGAGAPLPEVPAAYREQLATQPSPTDAVAASQALARATLEKLRPAVDFESFEGIHQVYGSLNDDASAQMRLLAVLHRAGPALHVKLAPCASRPDLYPMDVRVEADGRAVGVLQLTAQGAVEGRWPLPQRGDGESGAVVEVRLLPERWVLVPQGTSSTLASFKPVRIALED